jgi:hypothetical protein
MAATANIFKSFIFPSFELIYLEPLIAASNPIQDPIMTRMFPCARA